MAKAALGSLDVDEPWIRHATREETNSGGDVRTGHAGRAQKATDNFAMREFGDLCGFGWIGRTLGREVRETLSGITGSGVRFAFPEVEAFQDCLDALRLGDLDGGTITNDVHAQEPRESAEIFNVELDEKIFDQFVGSGGPVCSQYDVVDVNE